MRQQEQKTCGRGVFGAAGVFAGRGVPVRLVVKIGRILGGERDQIAGRSLQALPQPRLALLPEPIRNQTHEMLFDAHNHAFRVLGGVPQCGHLRQHANGRAVDQDRHAPRAPGQRPFLRDGPAISYSRREFCNPASGGEKGQIEKNGPGCPPSALVPMPDFPSLAALEPAGLETRCREL